MAFQPNAYYYDAQVRSYVLQFMAIFAGLQVQVGKLKTGGTVTEPAPVCEDPNATTQVPEILDERLISVPIRYGYSDRIVAAILADNVQTKPIRLPATSAVIKGIKIANDRMHGQKAERRNAYVPVGGLVPDDIKVVHQAMPVPYDLTMELSVYASNTEQQFQILEQIFMLFDPQLNIQKSDAPFDWTRLTQVTLDDIGMDQNYPIGTDRRIIQTSMSFIMPIWISAPADVKHDIVEKIFVRIGAVSQSAVTNYDIIAELDAQGIDYELWFNADDMNFQ
jgi:hypothetical protein